MPYLLAGPFVALIGIVAVFFVLRRKSEDKRSMYSARRSQIEHKVRAARQRTLTPHGRSQKPAEQTIPDASQAPAALQPTMVWESPAYEAPPVAPPSAPEVAAQPQQPPAASPWDVPAATQAPSPAPAFDYPPPAPAQPAYTPPRAEPAPSEPVWTPAPRPAEPMPPAETVAPAASATSATSSGGWSVVTTEKESAATVAPDGRKKGKAAATSTGDWSLASGEAPGAEADEPAARRSAGAVMAVAQYAVLVIGLVMVLIGVLVMVANSHVT
jgi:hypothetical protein